MRRYQRLYWAWLGVAILSGVAIVKFTGDLSVGDISVWPWALGCFVLFSVSMPCMIYYRSRKSTTSLEEKEQQVVQLSMMEGQDGKK